MLHYGQMRGIAFPLSPSHSSPNANDHEANGSESTGHRIVGARIKDLSDSLREPILLGDVDEREREREREDELKR